MSETEISDIGASDGPELDTAGAMEARAAERDAKLDAEVRDAAEQAFGRKRAESDAIADKAPSGDSWNVTLRKSWNAIHSREEPLTMPPLPMRDGKPPSIEETLAAQEQWNRASDSDKRAIAFSTRQVEELKQHAAALGVEVKTASDLAALRQMMEQGQQSNSPALDPEISKVIAPDAPDQASDRLRQIAQTAAQGPQGWRQVLEAYGYNPLELLNQQEQAALSGTYGGAIGRTLAEFQDVYSTYGIQPHEALRLLFSAERALRTDPQRAIAHLAESYGVAAPAADPGAQATNAVLGEWMQTKKGINQDVRNEMAAIIQEPGFASDDVPTLQLLNMAYTEARRRAGVRAKRPIDDKMTDTLAAKAREIGARR